MLNIIKISAYFRPGLKYSICCIALTALTVTETWAQIIRGPYGDGSCVKRAKWNCVTTIEAGTNYRKMQGTQFECGGGITLPFPPVTVAPGICGDWSHTQPDSWVDFVGGVSQSCEDHSSSFFGPNQGEWDGCSAEVQVSQGYQRIEGLSALKGIVIPAAVTSNDFCHYPYLEAAQPPPGGWQSQLDFSATTQDLFGSVYDLDTCTFKQLAGTIYWQDAEFVEVSRIQTPTSGRAVYKASAPVACAQPEKACSNYDLCSDLEITVTRYCSLDYAQPWTRCDDSCY